MRGKWSLEPPHPSGGRTLRLGAGIVALDLHPSSATVCVVLGGYSTFWYLSFPICRTKMMVFPSWDFY